MGRSRFDRSSSSPVSSAFLKAGDQLAETIRIEGAGLLATLTRIVGDLSVAEEAVQEAAVAALRDWQVHGVPDSPRAWLTTTGRRKGDRHPSTGACPPSQGAI